MASSIPAASKYFAQLAQTALGAQATVFMSRRLPLYTAALTLQIFGQAGDQEPGEMGPNYRREETYAIECEITSYSGDQDQPGAPIADQPSFARQDECFAALNKIETAIANDYTLGGNIRYAEVGEFDFAADADADGKSLGHLKFAVRCSQRVTSLT